LDRSIRVLVVDDYAPFRQLVCSKLQAQPELHVIGEASDGLEAVQKAAELLPDLILLNIGLPGLNGIEVARRIGMTVPKAKILFLSENRSWEVAEEALQTGPSGYLVKSDAAIELLFAVESVLQGKRFVSASMAGHDLTGPAGAQIASRHEAGFYSEDQWLLEDVTQFIGTVLRPGNSAVVIATEAHRNIFLRSLRAFGLDIDAAIEQGRYIAIDAAEALASFMVKGEPDPDRFKQRFSAVISKATKVAQGPHPRVGVFGECADLLCAEGNVEAAIQVERLGSELVKEYDLDVLCGYSVNNLRGMMDGAIHQRIREEHSAVHYH
jgi:DNA-binding NarL/FixJ family response regulator